MKICSEGHPLCYGVVFNPDLQSGSHNCYPKSANISQKLTNSPWVMHAALAQISYNTTCDAGTYVTTSSHKAFDRLCDQTADGEVIGQIHTSDFSTCIDYCSTYVNGNQSCSTAVYQPTAADQYENCYLKSSAQYIYSRTGYNFATLANGKVNATNTTNSPSSTGGSGISVPSSTFSNKNSDSSKAWIAGAVIGPLAAVAILVGVIIGRRRRRNRRDRASHTKVTDMSSYNESSAPLYPSSQFDVGAPSEVEARSVRRVELSANTTDHGLA